MKVFNIKKIIPPIMLAALIAITLMSVFVMKTPPSSELESVKNEYGNKKRTDYVDEAGNITMASDKHYATVIRTYDGKRMIEEEYFDDKGRKVTSFSGYHCIKRTYNEDGKADTDTYYDVNGKQVKSSSGYYAYKRGYNAEGKVDEITYRDISGDLMNNINGIAIIRREFDEDGRVRREFYYDKDGEPATSNLGQYGVLNEYNENGKVSKRTYLDEAGKPMETNLGYVSVGYIYTDDNTLLEERFFDRDGNPATGRYKEYGDRYENGETIYLDRNGNPMMRLDNYLYEHPVIVLIMGLCIMIAAFMAKGSAQWIMITFYIIFIVYMTLWSRGPGDTRTRFELFWSYKRFFIDPDLRRSVINNIWLFIPLGAMLYKPGSRRYLIFVLVSIIIEAAQYVAGLGLCELDDIFSNSLGGIIGYSLAYLFWGIFHRTDNAQKTDEHLSATSP